MTNNLQHFNKCLNRVKNDVSHRFQLLNKKGFALAETIIALLILSFALVGLLTMVQYGRVRAIANYNDRYVLLRVDGELQRIRFRHQQQSSFGQLNPISFNIPQLGRYQARPQTVTVNFTNTVEPDFDVGLDIYYHCITANAEWVEHMPRIGGRRIRPERRFITLREDYHFQRVFMND